MRRVGAIEFATTIAPGLRDVLLTGKIKGSRGSAGRQQTAGLRRRRGGLPADRPDNPVPGRDQALSTRQGGPVHSQAEGVE